MSKRSRFIFISGIISVALWLTTTAPVDYRFGLYLVVSAVSYVLSVWVLFDDLKGIEWLTLMVLPVMFTLGSGLFANFLPTAVPSMFGRAFQLETSMLLAGLFRILYFVFYALAMYGILLIENIFSVASINCGLNRPCSLKARATSRVSRPKICPSFPIIRFGETLV